MMSNINGICDPQCSSYDHNTQSCEFAKSSSIFVFCEPCRRYAESHLVGMTPIRLLT